MKRIPTPGEEGRSIIAGFTEVLGEDFGYDLEASAGLFFSMGVQMLEHAGYSKEEMLEYIRSVQVHSIQ